MSSSTTAMHAAMTFLNVVLLALLQLKYQNKETSPFEAHGTIILLYILASIIYSTAFIALLLRAHHQPPETPCLATLEHISLLTGALACDLLLLILAPPFGYFLLAFCGVLVLVKALLGSYQQIIGHLLDVAAISERARDLIPNVFHRSGRQEARNQAHAMASVCFQKY
ncbi:PROTEIN putative-RELATED [Salix purpurea]|uniref:PROTEIN putative-RELATED n=1 Tax=Salix purpurea TaxID=77065 RepID=A0A9Q0TGT9_SALPP|nr:PROTEIN putative-RELATED [Salix purpurea]